MAGLVLLYAFLKVHSKRQIAVFTCTVSTSMYIAWILLRKRERERDQTTVPIDSCLNLFHMFFYIDSHVNIL